MKITRSANQIALYIDSSILLDSICCALQNCQKSTESYHYLTDSSHNIHKWKRREAKNSLKTSFTSDSLKFTARHKITVKIEKRLTLPCDYRLDICENDSMRTYILNVFNITYKRNQSIG